MALKHQRSQEDVVRGCINRYLLDPTTTNIFSTLSKAFVECYLESKTERYISVFSHLVSEKLREAYLCSRLQSLFQSVSKRLDEIAGLLAKRYRVYELWLTTVSRLLVNTRGGQLPLEISIAWDPILNVPFIPSSSIKGVARSYFGELANPIGGYSVDKLFGSEECEGLIRFTDAYPVACRQVLVEPEVITPHYPEVKGYIDEASSAPVPLIFLTISPGTTFRLIIATKLDKTSALDNIVKTIAQALSKGIGAKTMLGYGRFTIQITHK